MKMHTDMIITPIQHATSTDFPIIQYVGDTILVLSVDTTQLMHVKNILLHFSAYTGLNVNYAKSTMVSINTSDNIMQQLSTLLGCKIGQLPHTYLGLPLSTSKPRVEDYTPLMKRIETRLLNCPSMLST